MHRNGHLRINPWAHCLETIEMINTAMNPTSQQLAEDMSSKFNYELRQEVSVLVFKVTLPVER